MAFNTTTVPVSLIAQSNVAAFTAKLTHDQRCAGLALIELGFSKRVVAKHLRVHKATLSHIIRPSSPHYKDVRRERAHMTKDEFAQAHVTDEDIKACVEFTLNVLAPAAVPRETPSFNKNARARMGIKHHDWNGYTFDFEVDWINPGDVRQDGWYWRDLSEPGWYGPFFTSQSAERAARSYNQTTSDAAP